MCGWCTLLPEVLHQSTTFLCSTTIYSEVDVDIQLLSRISSVCAQWRSIVYRESSGGHVDSWSCILAVSVIQSESDQEYYNQNEQRYHASIVPAALFSLRLVRSLLLRFFAPHCSVAAIIQPLQHYSRLVTLHICLANLHIEQNRTAQWRWKLRTH